MENERKEGQNINNVLNYRMKNYASTNVLFNAFTRSQNDPIPNPQSPIPKPHMPVLYVIIFNQ